jgi:hypothetical protein
MCNFKQNCEKCIIWEYVFKELWFQNIKKKKNGAFLNWRQVGMFLKMHDFKGKIAILPNA